MEIRLDDESSTLKPQLKPFFAFFPYPEQGPDGSPVAGELSIYDTSVEGLPPHVVTFVLDPALHPEGPLPARGFVNLEPYGGPHVGNCEEGAFVSRVYSDPDGFRFAFRELAAPPFCGGAQRSGFITGCYRMPETAVNDIDAQLEALRVKLRFP